MSELILCFFCGKGDVYPLVERLGVDGRYEIGSIIGLSDGI